MFDFLKRFSFKCCIFRKLWCA